MQFGYVSFCPPLQGPVLAAESESLGFHLRYFGENASAGSDPFAELRAAASATRRIRLAVGATNFVTRHPAVVAAAVAGVQIASGGRAVCGVATGDSALGVLGLRPQRIADFQADALSLRALLRGEAVPAGDSTMRIGWLDHEAYTPVPVEMMASGPRAIAAAAAVADRITLTVGASPERLRWALGELDAGLHATGRAREQVEVGAYAGVAIDDDASRAAERLRVRVKGIAHMASLPGVNLSTQPARLRTVTERLRTGYDYRHHDVRPDNPLGALVAPEFADWFGIGDPPGGSPSAWPSSRSSDSATCSWPGWPATSSSALPPRSSRSWPIRDRRRRSPGSLDRRGDVSGHLQEAQDLRPTLAAAVHRGDRDRARR